MKICIYGNCQAAPIKHMLYEKLRGHDVELLTLKAVHLIKPHEVEQIHEQVRSADVLISQRVSDNYWGMPLGTDQLAQLLKPNGRLIVIPSAYFDGYFPNFLYIKDVTGKTVSPRDEKYNCFPSDYHEAFCLLSKVHGLSESELNSLYTTTDYSLKFMEWVAHKAKASIEEMRQRDEKCDVKLADFMEAHYQTKQLFWTFNHPSKEVLNFICDEVVKILGVGSSTFIDKEYLDKEVIFPIFDYVAQALNLQFIPRMDHIHNCENYADYIAKCRRGYDIYPDLLTVNVPNPQLTMINGFLAQK